MSTLPSSWSAPTHSLALGLLAAGSSALLVGLLPGPASAATTTGTATIVAPGATGTTPLTSGGGATAFAVALPATASCSGDTAHDGYHVYSYLEPRGIDLSAVTFVNSPSTGYGLVNSTSTYYGPVNTAVGTGQIVGIPNDFEWGPLVTRGGGAVALSTLLSGRSRGVWEAGIVCANEHGRVTNVWSTQVTFTASDSAAEGFTWTAVPGAATAPAVAATSTPPKGDPTIADGAAVATRARSSSPTREAATAATGAGGRHAQGLEGGSGTGSMSLSGSTGSPGSGGAADPLVGQLAVAAAVLTGALVLGAGLVLLRRRATRRPAQ